MTDRQSTESPDIKKPGGGLDTSSPSALQQQQQAAALQAYYSSGAGGMAAPASSQSSALPPLLPMAAQLSQYGAAAGTGYAQAGTPTGTTDYSRRPLSVLF